MVLRFSTAQELAEAETLARSDAVPGLMVHGTLPMLNALYITFPSQELRLQFGAVLAEHDLTAEVVATGATRFRG